MAKPQPLISIVMGSDSDFPTMKEAALVLKKFELEYEISIVSAHRTPAHLKEFAEGARKRGIRVIIAGAGGAAHLPGMIASFTELPVIGVPVNIGSLQGVDSLYSIVQMPRGVPVACVAIGNAWNAGILAAQIIGASLGESHPDILDRIGNYKEELRRDVLSRQLPEL